MRKIILLSCGLIIITILYCFSLLNKNIFTDTVNEVLNIISILLFCVIIIPLFFEILSSQNVLKKIFYFGLNSLYSLLPFALFGQYKIFDNNLIILFSIITTIITAFFLYHKIKIINIIHLQYLEYSNLFLTVSFTIIFSILGLFVKGIETKMVLIYVSPLFILQILYKKIALDKYIQRIKYGT